MVDSARAKGVEPQDREVDVVLVGAGIMSATRGVTLTHLQPDLRIEMFEVLEKEAQESSSAWNNAGTGHAALCELNYTRCAATGASLSRRRSRSTSSSISRDSSGPTSFEAAP